MNRWSLKIASPLGIGVYVHASFLLIVAWVAFGRMQAGGGAGAVLESVLFLLALFGCVLLHELGHAVAAARYGIRTRDIILLPIGGLARLERMPTDPRQELVVAIAGPLVNVAIAAILWVWLSLTGTLVPADQVGLTVGPFFERLLVVNLGLVVFNLLPAFPMDGGRVLRSVLAMRVGPLKATRIAATIGKAMAGLFALVGIFFNPFLLLIAFFIWTGASQERALAEARARDPYGGWPPAAETGWVTPEERLRLAQLAAARAQIAAEERRLLDELRRRGPRG